MIHRKLDTRGDTLIEVVIATILIGTILFAAYSLSTRAFNLGQSARERSQATQLLQQQAEALRSLRDTSLGEDSAKWAAFRTKLKNSFTAPVSCRLPAAANNSGTFHMEKDNTGKWQAVNGGGYNPGAGNDDIADFYRIKIEGCLLGPLAGNPNADRLEAVITIQWARIGSNVDCTAAAPDPQCEVSQLRINLTDRNLPFSYAPELASQRRAG